MRIYDTSKTSVLEHDFETGLPIVHNKEEAKLIKLGEKYIKVCSNCKSKSQIIRHSIGKYKNLCVSCGLKQKYIDNPELGKKHGKFMRQYHADHPELSEKNRELMRQYHADHPELSEKWSEYVKKCYIDDPELGKKRSTHMKQYCDQSEINEKISKSNKQYFIDHPEMHEKVSKRLKQYFIDHPEMHEIYSKRVKQYFIDHPEEFENRCKRIMNSKKLYQFNDLKFDSSWELYYYLYETVIVKSNCIRNTEFGFKYEFGIYYPDFIVDGKIVEIKGDYELDEHGNLLDWKTKLKTTTEKSLAKTKCMYNNIDILLTGKDMLPIIDEVDNLFGKEYILQFKIK